MSNVISTELLLRRALVFNIKQRVDDSMLVLFASIVIIAEKEKVCPLVSFRTKGGLVNSAHKIINLLDSFESGLDFLVEEEVSSAGILILPAGKKIFAREKAIFEWHLQIPDPRDRGISKREYDAGDWSKAEYLSERSINKTAPEVFFGLMKNNKKIMAGQMKEIGLVHEIIP